MSLADPAESIASAEKRAKRFWIALVLFLFVIQSTIMGLVVHLAIGDPSAAVVPDYHNAALKWDETRRLLETADRLGWKIQFEPSDVADGRGMRALQVSIHNDRGAEVDELNVTGRLYHHARATDIQTIRFKPVGKGNYLVLAPVSKQGIWQLDLAIDGASEPMAKSLTFQVEES